MRLTALLSALFASIVILLISSLTNDNSKIWYFYSQNIRSSLFTGFLTLGGFLFSLKTFIVVKMKENVYDDKDYIKNLNEQRKITPGLSHYGPLKRLSNLLFLSVLSSIITSVSQFTIGLIDSPVSALICIWLSSFTIVLLIISLILIKINLDQWFSYLEK